MMRKMSLTLMKKKFLNWKKWWDPTKISSVSLDWKETKPASKPKKLKKFFNNTKIIEFLISFNPEKMNYPKFPPQKMWAFIDILNKLLISVRQSWTLMRGRSQKRRIISQVIKKNNKIVFGSRKKINMNGKDQWPDNETKEKITLIESGKANLQKKELI